ncbi:hypothetical protein [Paenibacillus sp. MDMC362]|uniref:hypothetical protein n=1 Tax=Paenibacillus sp. MDMC362 TaxID=2977365 RepID=UPI000DC59595|nr:hypothetical protein [Paenibacillus sp. MDMC362]RAR45952.1 hypothetical protein DP091_00355 [Paenibacillus sp. MDMC362]
MAFCTHCGNKLTEGVAHQCVDDIAANPMKYTAAATEPEQEHGASSSSGASDAKTASTIQVDGQVLLKLLKNPMSALNMRGDQTGLIYGMIGMASSVIGFWLFGLGIKQMFYSGLGMVSALLSNFGMGSRALLLGLFSTVILLGSFWFAGNMVTKQKLDWKEFIAKIGSFQLPFGAALIISGLISFMSLKLAFLILVFALMTGLAANSAAIIELYRIGSRQWMKFLGIAIGIYVLLFAIVQTVLL